MPHFIFDMDDDGMIRQIYKDGQPHREAVLLEQHFSVVTTYFKSAARNLKMMQSAEVREDKRHYGLQSFLMAMTGLEAFTNTYFRHRADELSKPELIERIEQKHGSITRKIAELLVISGDGPLHDQDALIRRLFELSELRHEIVHPRWTPSLMSISGEVWLHIGSLVENRQGLLEDSMFCREAVDWCLLLVARVAQSQGIKDISGFMFFWTATYKFSMKQLLKDLGLPAEE